MGELTGVRSGENFLPDSRGVVVSDSAIVVSTGSNPVKRWPGWPDARGWVIAGFFGLEFYILYMVREDGTLLANASFMQMAANITTGGVLLIAMNMFGGTKAGAEMNTKVGEALTASVTKDKTP